MGRVSIRWVGDGCIRMNMRDIRNEEVLRDISDCAEILYIEGHVGERVLNMKETVECEFYLRVWGVKIGSVSEWLASV